MAGEAAAVQRIRRHLFEDRGLPRPQASVRGYWKRGCSGDADDDTEATERALPGPDNVSPTRSGRAAP